MDRNKTQKYLTATYLKLTRLIKVIQISNFLEFYCQRWQCKTSNSLVYLHIVSPTTIFSVRHRAAIFLWNKKKSKSVSLFLFIFLFCSSKYYYFIFEKILFFHFILSYCAHRGTHDWKSQRKQNTRRRRWKLFSLFPRTVLLPVRKQKPSDGKLRMANCSLCIYVYIYIHVYFVSIRNATKTSL